jgi:Domain of unknown function (DUF4198)
MSMALALIATGSAYGHETWLLPGRARIDAPGPVILSVSSGMDFPKPDTALRPDRAKLSWVRQGGADEPLEVLNAIGGSTVLRATLKRPGLARIWMDLSAIPLELSADLVDVYFDEIQADAALREGWAKVQPRPWRESYAKFATTFVRVGAPDPNDRSWAEPIGGSLEIVPEADPTALGTDPVLRVRVLKFGIPLPGLMIAAQAGGMRDWKRTDENGRAGFQLKGNGPWLIHGTQLTRVDRPDLDWESWFTTLTIPRQ